MREHERIEIDGFFGCSPTREPGEGPREQVKGGRGFLSRVDEILSDTPVRRRRRRRFGSAHRKKD